MTSARPRASTWPPGRVAKSWPRSVRSSEKSCPSATGKRYIETARGTLQVRCALACGANAAVSAASRARPGRARKRLRRMHQTSTKATPGMSFRAEFRSDARRVQRLLGARREVGPVDTGQLQGARHGPDLRAQDAQQQVG